MIVAVTAGGSGGSFCFDPRRQKKKEEKRAQTGGLRRMSGANFAKERHWSIPQYLKESDENGAYEVGMKSKRPRKAQRGDQTKKKGRLRKQKRNEVRTILSISDDIVDRDSAG
jgi:hypothetical protein